MSTRKMLGSSTTAVSEFGEIVDVVVVGFGNAGAISAINAVDAGAKVLLIEKSEVPGGLSICSYGAVRSARDRDAAFTYLHATNGGRTPDDVLRALADGMCDMEHYVRDLAKINGAVISTSIEENAQREREHDPYRRRISANYPLPGTDAFYHTSVVDVPGFDVRKHYPWANGAPNGPKLFKVVHDNVVRRGIDIRLATRAIRLIADPRTRAVRGITVEGGSREYNIGARRAVILACGGFEGDAEMKQQFLEGKPILNAAARTNTGDGIRMAQDLGAALWHMWLVHGSYGFRHVDSDYPYAIRLKRFPDWFPGEQHNAQVRMAWIMLDQAGNRFMSEYQPYTQDTAIRPMHFFDPVTQRFPRNPAFMICDEEGRKMYPLGRATSNDKGIRYEWSEDNLKEVEIGILKSATTLNELASILGLDPDATMRAIVRWNEMCARGSDEDFGRPGGTMVPIRTAPFYGAPVWATLSNTQGGPVHDAEQRVIDVYGKPIPRLYSAGELGSSFGHLYFSGGNIAECFITGRIAGCNAARQPA